MYLPVVVLDDITNCPDGCQVLIVALWADVVEGLRRPRIPVRACEVNGDLDQEDTGQHTESFSVTR